MGDRTARAALAICVAAMLVACGDPNSAGPGFDPPWSSGPEAGGQSGGEGTEGCFPRGVPLDAVEGDAARLAAQLDALEQALAAPLPLQWWPADRPDALMPRTEIELSELDFRAAVESCRELEIEVELRARSRDGLFDAQFSGRLSGNYPDTAWLRLVASAVDAVPAGPLRAELRGGDLVLALYWSPKQHEIHRIGLFAPGVLASAGWGVSPTEIEPAGHVQIGWIDGDGFVPSWANWPRAVQPSAPVVPTGVQRRICAGVQATSPASFATEADALRALEKRWVICDGVSNRDPSFAGFAIDAGGRFHELAVEGDELVAVQGFQHEGVVASDGSNDFEMVLRDWQGGLITTELSLSAEGNTLHAKLSGLVVEIDALFQATDLPVRYAPLPELGARLGESACETEEGWIASRQASAKEMEELLLGRWVFCSGGFDSGHAGIEFARGGKYHFLDASGARAKANSGRFEIYDTGSANGAGAYHVDLYFGAQRYIMSPEFSRAPMKMLAGDDLSSVLSAW